MANRVNKKTDREFIIVGNRIPPDLLEEWRDFHSPSRNYSPSAAAAFLLYMVVEPATREALRKLACQKDIKEAKKEARRILNAGSNHE